MNLATLKQEARDGYVKLFPLDDFSMFSPQGSKVAEYLDTLIDKVVDAVEAATRMVGEGDFPFDPNDNAEGNYWQGINQGHVNASEELREAFRNFRGV